MMNKQESKNDNFEEEVGLITGSTNKKLADDREPTFLMTALDFCICFGGLQISYIVWGMMQELIMDTQFKPTPLSPSGHFPSATFCVFSNRFLAIIVSAVFCIVYHGSLKSHAPLLSFAPCALSNTISSWGQYQALSFVSFSLQTIFKSTKIVPVMLMGTMLKGTKYSLIEYAEAVGITIGVVIFSMSKGNYISNSASNEIVGFFLLCLYVLSDSFTSQWQSRIYTDYGKIDHFQMMFGVNVSAIIITSAALILTGEIFTVSEFLYYNPTALYYNIITAVTSTTGQFAIFYTIKRFGPIVFTVIMTTRQMLSIVVSNYLFNHSMSLESYVGSAIVFSVISMSILHKVLEKKRLREAAAAVRATMEGENDTENNNKNCTSNSSSSSSSNNSHNGMTSLGSSSSFILTTTRGLSTSTSPTSGIREDSSSSVLEIPVMMSRNSSNCNINVTSKV